MAKSPVPGRVKTRLCPPLSAVEAATVAAASLADTLASVAGCRAERKIIALDGEPGWWLPPGLTVIPQHGSGLAERLCNAWEMVGGSGIQIGMDTPQVSSVELDEVLTLNQVDDGAAVLGLAQDGGWWVIGWRRANPGQVFRGIPMSTARTGLLQRRRLERLGLSVRMAGMRRDIDTVDDLLHVAAEAPDSQTAAVAFELGIAERAA